MEIVNIIIWGFGATVVLTIIMAASKPLGFSRIDIPFLLGTMFTGNRDKASLVGLLVHIAIGWVFAFIYAIAFETTGVNSILLGPLIGFVHANFVLSAGLLVLSALHPRMAKPYEGPDSRRQLQPPGFYALNYGSGTPIVTLIAHVVYGAILGSFY